MGAQLTRPRKILRMLVSNENDRVTFIHEASLAAAFSSTPATHPRLIAPAH